MNTQSTALQFQWTPYQHQSCVSISQCDPAAKSVARWVMQQLTAAMPVVCHLEHIGSSALGIAGKGIIDVALYYYKDKCNSNNRYGCTHNNVGSYAKRIDTLTVAQKRDCIAPIEQILLTTGWQYEKARSQFPAHRPRYDIGVKIQYPAQRGTTKASTYFSVYCHLLPYAGLEMQKQRCFRQRLLQSPSLQRDYQAIKQAILEQGVTEPVRYGKHKSVFIKRVLQESGY